MRIHEGQPVLRDGAPLATAGAVLILLHGRGSRAEEMIELGRALRLPNVALVAPQAADGEWYPQRFLAPRAQNEPWLASALAVLARLIDEVDGEVRLREMIVLGGFSQGACLAMDFAASHPRRYAAVLGLSGALIGLLTAGTNTAVRSAARRFSSAVRNAIRIFPSSTCAPVRRPFATWVRS